MQSILGSGRSTLRRRTWRTRALVVLLATCGAAAYGASAGAVSAFACSTNEYAPGYCYWQSNGSGSNSSNVKQYDPNYPYLGEVTIQPNKGYYYWLGWLYKSGWHACHNDIPIGLNANQSGVLCTSVQDKTTEHVEETSGASSYNLVQFN
jgi:hypothetical protein